MTTQIHYAPPANTGEILNVGFGSFFSRLLPFLFLSVLAHLPLVLTGVFGDAEDVMFGRDGTWVVLVVDALLSMVLVGAVTAIVVGRLRGEEPRLGGALLTGLKRSPAVLGVSILLALIVGVPVVALLFIGSLMGLLGLILFGIVAVIVAFLLLSRFWVALPAVVVEVPAPILALETSSTLTAGRRASVIGALVVATIVTGVLAWIGNKIVLGLDAPTTALMVQIGFSSVLSLITLALPAAGYYLLAAEHEARWVEEKRRAERAAAKKAAAKAAARAAARSAVQPGPHPAAPAH